MLYSQGKTRVLCTAMVEDGVPRWLYRSGRGWMTAEYSLLPASTGERVAARGGEGKQGGRTVEIQRLIGRALRSVCDFEALGERTLWLDCDVLQADGGTRCAAISGAYVAASRALDRFGLSKALTGQIAAVSVGVVDGRPLLDLDYSEDSSAETDMNVVMTADGRLVEVQATAEREPFTRDELDELLDLAAAGSSGSSRRRTRPSRPSVPELSTAEALLRLLVAAGLGGAIGLERELRDHEAGFRTHLLVSLGACVFTLVSAYAWTDWTFSTPSGVVFDPTRIAAQIVTGIGFLGAGAIIVRGISVRGLTTAATLWVVAAIGMAAGTGYYAVGVGAALLVLISLGPLQLISRRLVARVRPEEAELAIRLAPDGDGPRCSPRSRSSAARSVTSSSATSARST